MPEINPASPGTRLSVAVGATDFVGSCGAGSTFAAGLGMSVMLRHTVGDQLPFGLSLGDERRAGLRECGGQLPPSAYLAVGPLILAERWTDANGQPRPGWRLTVDCGLHLEVGHASAPPPHVRESQLVPGDWMAHLGNLHLEYGDRGRILPLTGRSLSELPLRAGEPVLPTPGRREESGSSDPSVPPTRAVIHGAMRRYLWRLIGGSVIDLRPNSPSFGLQIDWPPNLPPPHDPDVVSFPTRFVHVELLGLA